MKKLIYILTVFILFSCGTTTTITEKNYEAQSKKLSQRLNNTALSDNPTIEELTEMVNRMDNDFTLLWNLTIFRLDNLDNKVAVLEDLSVEPPTDTDGDGIIDIYDDCPNQFGNMSNGCPVEYKDTDGDGVIDLYDDCPNEYGEDDNGCPIIIEPPTGNYPPEVNPETYNWGSFTLPNANLNLGYLQELPDAKTDAIIRRVAPDNVSVFTVKYAKNSVYNSDGTRMKGSSENGTGIIDSATGELLYYVSAPNFGNWSHTEPDLMYGVTSNTNQWKELKVSTNHTTIVRSFSGYSKVSIGEGEGRISIDDKYVALIGTRSGGRDIIVYNIKDDVIVATKALPSGGDLDWVSVTQSGKYVILMWRGVGNGSTQGTKRLNIDLTNEINIWDKYAHGDLGTDVNGKDVFVGLLGQGSVNLVMIRIEDGFTATTDDIKIYGGHVSTTNFKRPGYAYISESCCGEDGRPSTDVFALKLDYTFTKAENLGRTFANPISGKESSPMFCPSPDGTQGALNSYRNNNGYKSKYPSYAPMHQLFFKQ